MNGLVKINHIIKYVFEEKYFSDFAQFYGLLFHISCKVLSLLQSLPFNFSATDVETCLTCGRNYILELNQLSLGGLIEVKADGKSKLYIFKDFFYFRMSPTKMFILSACPIDWVNQGTNKKHFPNNNLQLCDFKFTNKKHVICHWNIFTFVADLTWK